MDLIVNRAAPERACAGLGLRGAGRCADHRRPPTWTLLGAVLLGCVLSLLLPVLAFGSAYHHKARVSEPAAGPLASGLRAHRPSLGSGPASAQWVCPQGRCEAILAPEPTRAAAGWRQPGSERALEGDGEFGGLAPEELRAAYDIPASIETAETVAVVDPYGYTDAESDLAAYRSRYGLPACTNASGCFRRVNETGEQGNYPRTDAAWDEEAALDLDMVSAACSECHILLVEPRNEGEDNVAEGANTAARLGASVISNSYATNEAECASDGCVPLDKDYEHPGVLVTASAGDWGYDDLYFASIGEEPYGTFFPASAPGVVAVGGTALYRDSGSPRGWREEVWNEPKSSVDRSAGAGTSGGCTTLQPKPPWQTDMGCEHRTDNDIAAVAALETPVSVRIDGRWGDYGGTSVAAPLVAGIEAHASAYVRSLGPEAFYQDSGSLNDVTEGFDYYPGPSPCAAQEYLCNAEIGYDGPTGLGTPDGVPAIAQQDAPAVTVQAASDLSGSSAELTGTVNPRGMEVSECTFEYGTSSNYGSSVACNPAPGEGSGPVAVSASLSGLKPGTTYDFRILARGSGGISYSANESFATLTAPAASIGVASAVTIVSASVGGTVDPEGSQVSECELEYSPASATSWSSVPCSPMPGSGSAAVEVAGAISQLRAATSYDYRIFARNTAGSTRSSTGAFKTLPGPLVSIAPATEVTASSAQLSGTVNPEGEAVLECRFEYGSSTDYGSSVPCSTDPGAGVSAIAVSASLTGAKAPRTYDFRLFVKDAAGSVESANRTFTTPPPPTASASSASEITATSAHLRGGVNPRGTKVTGCDFEYGTNTKYGSSVACNPAPGAGTTTVAVSATAAPLKASTSYDFRVVVTSSAGTTASPNAAFKTANASAVSLIRPLR